MSDKITVSITRTLHHGAPFDASKGYAIGKLTRVASFSFSAADFKVNEHTRALVVQGAAAGALFVATGQLIEEYK